MKSLKVNTRPITSQTISIPSIGVNFTIESNVEIPEWRNRVSPLRPVWDAMKVNDSIIVPDQAQANRFRGLAKDSPYTIVTRKETGTTGSIRLWKVSTEPK